MSWTSDAHQTAPLPPALPIPEDEAPTAFYRRPRRKGSGARPHGDAPAPPPRRSSKRRGNPRRNKIEPTASPSPPTLLLPTSEARDQTSDGTILSPLAEPTRLPSGRWSELHHSWRRLLSTMSRVAASTPAGRTCGLWLISAATALALVGVAAVAYVYTATGDPRRGPAITSHSHERGLVAHVVDLGRRLRMAPADPEGRP